MPVPSGELVALLDLARETAVTAGALIRRRRSEGVEVAAFKSTATDIVTAADREAEGLIKGLLHDARPGDGFLGEEGGTAQSLTGLTWVVDPIDGTANYFYDIPSYCVSIAVVEGGVDPATWRPLAGCVVNPVTGEVYTASLGGGAFLGARRLHVNTGVELSDAMVGTGFGYAAEVRMKQARVVGDLIGRIRDIRRAGSAALDLCHVASGQLDAYYERGLKPWDFAAGALIAQEAGATTGYEPGPRPLVIAAEPVLYAQLAPLVSVSE
ncbi:inositol monophosphatase family protein [Gryllotalpicola sp.]|uniref:inositol monophosphatase family protein n=1 Tax=Gryllotalpicola sp. TaxID=1932787 RepID=UPI002604E180|nr:inositol monophosphatase family protein [Gryllotalpicola sp.]